MEKNPHFMTVPVETLTIPVYLEKKLETRLQPHTKIDVVGWAYFKRLVLVPA